MKNFFQTLQTWHRGNNAARNLRLLNDNMLNDIGIARGDIRSPANIFH